MRICAATRPREGVGLASAGPVDLLRVRASFFFEEVAINSRQHVPRVRPRFTAAEDAARLIRAQWRSTDGPVIDPVDGGRGLPQCSKRDFAAAHH